MSDIWRETFEREIKIKIGVGLGGCLPVWHNLSTICSLTEHLLKDVFRKVTSAYMRETIL